MSIGVCGALDEDTEDGAVEDDGTASDGISCEFGMRQSPEDGVSEPEADGVDEGQAALAPFAALGDCLSRMFIVPNMQSSAQ